METPVVRVLHLAAAVVAEQRIRRHQGALPPAKGRISHLEALFTEGVALLRVSPPKVVSIDSSADFELWYWGGLLASHMHDEVWTAWRVPLREALLTSQSTTTGRDERGSWPAATARERHGGRVFVTALNCMSLQLDYRYGPLFREKR